MAKFLPTSVGYINLDNVLRIASVERRTDTHYVAAITFIDGDRMPLNVKFDKKYLYLLAPPKDENADPGA